MGFKTLFLSALLVFLSLDVLPKCSSFGGGDVSSYLNFFSNRAGEYDPSKTHPRQLSPSAASSSVAAAYDSPDEFGNLPAAGGHYGGGGHGGGGHGGGHGGGGGGAGGWKWGWGGGGGGGGHGKKADCNSALGLLGVLGLASYLQNILRQMNNGTRIGRDLHGFDHHERRQEIQLTSLILPMLSAVAHVKDGLVAPHCAQYPVCEVNRLIASEMGHKGATVAELVTKAIARMLNPGYKEQYQQKKQKGPRSGYYYGNGSEGGGGGGGGAKNGGKFNREWFKIQEAGKIGRGKKRCDSFEYCRELRNLPMYALPPGGFWKG